MGVHLTLDNVGWIYIGVAVGWSVVLYTGFGFLWCHRRLPQLRIRRLPLVFVALTMLHVYWILCMIGYVIGSVAPCAAEYWVMSILVPFGIAMFQVANTQFMHIASQQRRYATLSSLGSLAWEMRVSVLDGQTGPVWRRILKRLKNINQITRMVIYVGIGMTLQAVLTIFIFLLSKKFHPSFGLFPTNLFGTDSEQRVQCSRGWEWWLSIVWQFFWAWIYAPYVLWKSRDIKDTHGWRIQTILCCIAGLPCSPLWLCGLYLPQFAPVNAVFVPPNWFSISVFFIQLFTVFIPCYQIHQDRHLRKETLAAIADWETKQKRMDSVVVGSGATRVNWSFDFPFRTSNEIEKGTSRHNSVDRSLILKSKKNHLCTMTALECTLRWNPNPLQKFAALKDFSGENISFLTHLASWKNTLSQQDHGTQRLSLSIQQQPHHHQEDTLKGETLREAYNRAITLYTVFISHEHAEFPINLSHRTIRRLDALFSRPANLIFGDSSSQNSVNSATPFTCDRSKPVTMTDVLELRNESVGSSSSSTATVGVLCLDGVYYWGEIPVDFNMDCFDDAEREIKYLVLTNTWPKFVNAGYAEEIRDSQGKTLGRRLTQHFYRRPHW